MRIVYNVYNKEYILKLWDWTEIFNKLFLSKNSLI